MCWQMIEYIGELKLMITIEYINDYPSLFSRPRDRSRMMEVPESDRVRNYDLDFRYNRHTHDDE